MPRVCINPMCESTVDLVSADLGVKRHYGVKRSNVGSDDDVCKTCLGLYEINAKNTKEKKDETQQEECQQESSDDDIQVVGVFDDKVVEEESEDSEYELESDIDLDELIIDCLDRLNFQAKASDALDDIRNRVDKLQKEGTRIGKTLEDMNDQMNNLRPVVDEMLGIVREEAPPVEFTFSIPVQPPSHPLTNFAAPASGYRHDMRSISRPALKPMMMQSSAKSDSSLEVIPMGTVPCINKPNLPPVGSIKRRDLQLNMRVYAMRASFFGIWYKATIVEIVTTSTNERQYKVRFDLKKTTAHIRTLSGKHLAYTEPADVILPVGTRVIALYKDEYWSHSNSMYAGIIAEPPKIMNKYRYLVFFDDGYAQYINHNQINLVCEVSKDVWDDIHPDSKEFIRGYLQQYPERPMVKLQKGQVVKTEWNGKWWIARVLDVDASLVKMHFDADKRTEWIYRGSTRLAPLFSELANAEANKLTGKLRRHTNVLFNKKKNAPYVEYTRGFEEPQRAEQVQESSAAYSEDDDDDDQSDKKQVAKKHTLGAQLQALQRANVAKKSTGFRPIAPAPAPTFASYTPYRHTYRAENEGVYEIKFKQKLDQRQKYRAHECSSTCINGYPNDPVKMKGNNPLLIPMLCGWERLIGKYQTSGKRVVLYRAPCGRRLRNIEEIHIYLTATGTLLTVDLFCFDTIVHCFGEFVPAQAFCYIRDISYSKENVPVSCVNSISRQYPEYVEYSTERIPAKGVTINTDPEFLIGCDCTDDCKDPSKCSCQNLTMSTLFDYQLNTEIVGYQFRRLTEQISTGIYECNSRCKCRKQCLNRVVQHGLQLRLQVFKTEKRGWGLRCLDDIPQGGFICIYAGQLLNEQGANEDGTQFGDEYLAELDYIEVVERSKDGYENDVVEPEEEKKDEEKKVEEESSETDSAEEDADYDAMQDRYDSGDRGDSSDSDFETRVKQPIEPRRRSSRSFDRVAKHKSNNGIQDNHNETKNDKECAVTKISELDKESTEAKISEPDKKSTATKTSEMDKESMASNEDSNASQDTADSSTVKKKLTMEEESDSQNTTEMDTNENKDSDREKKQTFRFRSLPNPKLNVSNSQSMDVEPSVTPYKSVRSYFGEEFCYIMDAKAIGNIGRYLNHGCSPNVFVQNVFVDTHDLRFPWVSFFANQYIRAGTELTWDYNYDVGSVPGKVLYCYCGAPECRGRLL